MTGTRMLIAGLFFTVLWTPFFLVFIHMRRVEHGTLSIADRIVAGLPWLASIPFTAAGLTLSLLGI